MEERELRTMAQMLALTIHALASRPDQYTGLTECFERNEYLDHVPCYALGLRLARVLDEAGWKKNPVEMWNEGRWAGTRDGLYAALALLADPDDVWDEPEFEPDPALVRERVREMIRKVHRGDKDWRHTRPRAA